MAPRGHMHFHPMGQSYCDDFAAASLGLQAHFIHEMTHVWQTQTRGEWYLVLNRMPWSRYDYSLKPGWRLHPIWDRAAGRDCKTRFFNALRCKSGRCE